MKDITPEEAQQLLDQHNAIQSGDISPEEAKQLLAQQSGNKSLTALLKSGLGNIGAGVKKSLDPSALAQAPQKAENLSRGALAGLLTGGMDIGETQAKGLRALGIPVGSYQQTGVPAQISQLYSPEVAASPQGQVGFAAGQYGPLAATPMGKGGVLTQTAKTFGLNELLNAIMNPNKKISESLTSPESLTSSAEAAAIPFGLGTLSKGLGTALTMGGKAAPEEFARNVFAAGEKPVGVPELGRAPVASGLEQNILANTPLSGHAQRSMQVGEMMDKDVNGLLDELNPIKEDKPRYRINIDKDTGQITGESTPVKIMTQQEKIAKNFRDNISKNEKKKNQLYNARDEAAKNTEGSFTADTRKQIAERHLDDINKEVEEKGYTTVSPETERELKAASKNNPIDFSRLNFNRKAYNDLADKFNAQGNKYEAKIFNQLAEGYNTDIKNAIEKTGSQELKEAQRAADKHFKEKIVPVRKDQKLYDQSLESTATPNRFLADTISEGRYDDPTTMSTVLKNLDPDYKKQYAREFLTRGSKEILGTDEIGADKVLSTYNKLGDETKRLLFSNPKHRELLDKNLKVRQLMGTGINQMINPKTGYSHAKLLASGLAAALAGAAGHAGTMMGMPPIESYLAGTALTGGGANLLSKYLTSPLARKIYMQGAKLKQIPPLPIVPVNPALASQQNQ